MSPSSPTPVSNPTPNPWIYAGPTTSFPNIPSTLPRTRIAKPPPDPWDPIDPSAPPPPCKILQLAYPLEPKPQTLVQAQLYVGWEPQVMVFRYKGKFHAIDHACPHRAAPLSRGHLVDIEDVGVGVMCPKHEWTFELEGGRTGMSERVRLGVWEAEVRRDEGSDGDGEEGVWVRRRVAW